MPGNYAYSVVTGKVTLTAAATKSLWLLNPVTNPIRLTEVSVSFDGSTSAQGVQVDLYRVATLGSPAGTTGTVSLLTDDNTPAATTTALTALTAEPTSVTVLRQWMVSPFGGLYIGQEVLDRELGTKSAGSRIGLRYTTASGVSPNAVSYVTFVE
ncbi:hypothetical protein [Streptomyces sp. NPDC001404]|uniref:hypothetical protein n=1 Tax=Streptomyces sp. NPDC001404 TaxID=3364571 RepID=UPI0036A66F08